MRRVLFLTGVYGTLAVLLSVTAAQPRQLSSETPVASAAPSPVPSNVATPSPLFANKAYFYRGEDNDPKKHPVPPEVQLGFKRDNTIYCLDWYRMPRTSRRNDWTYYVTTCQCYPEYIVRSIKGKN